MNATDFYKAGKLREALDAQLQEVKSHPSDQGRRLFLFELAAFAGDLDRARRQIDALSYDDPDLERARGGYRKLLDAEEARRKFFRDGVPPGTVAEPPEHVAWRLEAVASLRNARPEEAADLIRRANEALPTLRGQYNGKPFDGLRDFDDLFGTVLEVFAQGQYFWVPLEQVATLAINPPRFPRDLIWVPAKLLTRTGEEGDVFLPALYPGSHEHADDTIRLGRATDWSEGDSTPVRGVGLRTYLIGDHAEPILEWRELQIEG